MPFLPFPIVCVVALLSVDVAAEKGQWVFQFDQIKHPQKSKNTMPIVSNTMSIESI